MSSPVEVGLFIDFENIRFGFLNHFGQEPDPQRLMEKARRYGPVSVAYAYADFTQHPAVYRRKLEVAGITPRDVPRRSPDVVHKSSADMAMLMDMIDCLLDRPSVHTLVLMTGDSDFIRVTARARHRFGKQVVIAGVPGSVSNDLVESADLFDPLGEDLEPLGAGGEPGEQDEAFRVLQLVLWLDEHRPYMTFGFIRSHAMSPHHGLGLDEERVTEILSDFKESGILVESYRPTEDGRTLRTLELNATHPRVTACAQAGVPAFESEEDREDGEDDGGGEAGGDPAGEPREEPAEGSARGVTNGAEATAGSPESLAAEPDPPADGAGATANPVSRGGE